VHGFIRWNTRQYGVLFNDRLAERCAFIQLCDKNRKPRLFLQKYQLGSCRTASTSGARLTKDGAKLIMAVARCVRSEISGGLQRIVRGWTYAFRAGRF